MKSLFDFLFPILKRIIFLLSRAKLFPSLVSVNFENQIGQNQCVGNTFIAEIKCKNSIFVKINHIFIPIFFDTQIVKIKYPTNIGQGKVKIKTFGLLGYRSFNVATLNSMPITKTPRFKKKFIFENVSLSKSDLVSLKVHSEEFKLLKGFQIKTSKTLRLLNELDEIEVLLNKKTIEHE